MPEPNEYLALVALQTALKAMAVADGYHFDVAGLAVKLDPDVDVASIVPPGGNRPFVILEVKPDSAEYQPAKQLRLTLPVTVHWIADSEPTDDASRLLTFFRGCADVERAIGGDITLGGTVTYTGIVRRTFDTSVDGAQVWAQIDVQLRVHRTYGAPDR